MTNCKVVSKADVGSDQISKNDTEDKQKVSKAVNHKKQKPFNIKTQKLKGMKERFEINIKTDLNNLRRR